jgi:twitching motility protein PilT
METSTQTPPAQRVIHTAQLIAAMLKSNGHVSDLIFSPGRAPQIEVSGQLVELKYKGLECLSAADTKSIAYDIMGENEHPLRKLDQDGSADLSYGLAGVGRFRVNIFRQRGSCAIVMRVIPDKIPGFEDLKLPSRLEEIVHLKNGIVLVTGPTGSGKSARRHHRQNERREGPSHPHHRGSHRVSASPQESHHSPARAA